MRRPIVAAALISLAVGGTAAAVVPAAGPGAEAQPPSPAEQERVTAERLATLAGAAGWRDALEAYRAPARPAPAETESAIVVLEGPPTSRVPSADRAAAARSLESGQSAVEQTLRSLGATVTFRYRTLLNGMAVRAPAGRLPALARLPEVRAVVPVEYLAPAQAEPPQRGAPQGAEPTSPAAPEPRQGPDPGQDGVRIALIDTAVDPGHPWLGGGVGPTFPIVGGADFVEGDDDPTVEPGDLSLEAHGTQVASLVLRDPALAGLDAQDRPRIESLRVVAPEPVAGRLRPLARTDRVIAALERAVDPNEDGSTDDRAEIVLLGLAGGFGGGPDDPVATAVAAADRVGSLVVVPAGNDGPTYTRPGSIGAPASVPTALTVGAIAEPIAGRLDLELAVGPARPRLAGLPALGAPPDGEPRGVRILEGAEGPAPGNTPGEFRAPDGSSLVDGRLVVVGRGGATLATKARHAAAAGAAGLIVWDLTGPPTFPTDLSAPGAEIPIVGVGPGQGEALARLVREQPSLTGQLASPRVAPGTRAIAAFSSRGPAPSGAPKPDVVAPGVALLTAWPREDGTGAPTATLSGTSASAAQLAARAARIAIERPDLGPREIHSVLVQSATPIDGAAWHDQGAGDATTPQGTPQLASTPAIVAVDPEATRTPVRFRDLTGAPGRYEVVLANAPDEPALARFDLEAGKSAGARLELPADARGWLWVRERESGRVVSRVPLVARTPASTPKHALGTPLVSESGGTAVARVRVGVRERRGGRIVSARLGDVRLSLRPVGGGRALPLTHQARDGGWPAGTYRILIATRVATGLEIPKGRYRLQVSATGPDGTALRRTSEPFRIG